MSDGLMRLAAFLVLAAFLSILVIFVPRVDLGLVVLATLALAAYDFYTTKR